ncbi:MAG: HRDC domain-containing protein, partial [Ignavibacteriaceae bacterium]|nr:HRDC domain-containing protein [Ignavibacteriaceae bacterium]
TYGGCANYDANDLKHVLQEMISDKLIRKEKSGSKLVMLDDKGIEILRRIEPEKEIKKEDTGYEKNLELYNFLTDVRKKAAKRFGQSADIICPNEVLIKIAENKPTTKSALFNIEGVNNRMYNKIGEELLESIKEFGTGEKLFSADEAKKEESKQLPSFLSETLSLLKKGYPLKDIASLRNLTEAVISMQIETILEFFPDTEISYLYDSNILQSTFDEIKKGYKDLKELKTRLPGVVSYPLIRIAIAKFKASSQPFV